MSDIQIKKSAEKYDAIIVGSGAGGGMAGYVLAHAGLKVLMLEAGPFFDPQKDSQQLKWSYESPRRGAGTTRYFGDFDAAYGGWELEGEPYTTKDKTEFFWFRSRMLGGRTNHWGRISLRMGPNDFKGHHIDGLVDDWPITYDEVKPFYDKVDRMIGVYGTVENLPNEPDGIFLPPPKPRLNELFIAKGAAKAGVKVIPGRGSVLTEALPGNKDRGACFFCGQCGRSCKIYGDFSASSCLVIPAMKTGNLKVISNAMVREVLTDSKGLATGVSYINKEDMQEYQVNAAMVILGASAGESARLLLNSKSQQHPGGLANSSGVVGKYLHDSTGSSAGGWLPQLVDRKRYNEDGVGSVHIYAPWLPTGNKKFDFARGYHIEFGGGLGMPGYGFGFGMENMNGTIPGRDGKTKEAGGFGASLKDDYRRFYGVGFGMAGRGTAIARDTNYCEIDPNVVDKFGIPVLRFNYTWSNDEINQAKHMQETFQSIMHEMGAIYGPPQGKETNYGLEAPGKIIHEVGTVRMGDDPKKSALNKYCQAHDCKNLFVVDAAPFVQQGDKNATWTILALSMRTAEYILAQRKKLNV